MAAMLKADPLNFYVTAEKPFDSYEAIFQQFMDHCLSQEQKK